MRRLRTRLRAWRQEAFGQPPLPEDRPWFRTVKLPPLVTTETTPFSPDPDTPQWTWTDEAREAVLRSAWNVDPGEACDDDWVSAEAVLDSLTPHGARQVAALTAELERAHYALGLKALKLFQTTAERDALQRQVDSPGDAVAKLDVLVAWSPFRPYASVLDGSTVVHHSWGITRWHALGRAARWARLQPGPTRVTVARWAPDWDGEPGGTAPWGVPD